MVVVAIVLIVIVVVEVGAVVAAGMGVAGVVDVWCCRGKGQDRVRVAGVGLLAVALLKLFLHDLAALPNLYRIGALLATAVIAIAASFLYQKLLAEPSGWPEEKSSDDDENDVESE